MKRQFTVNIPDAPKKEHYFLHSQYHQLIAVSLILNSFLNEKDHYGFGFNFPIIDR